MRPYYLALLALLPIILSTLDGPRSTEESLVTIPVVRTYCDPDATPPQFCPDGRPCPNCGHIQRAERRHE